MKIVLFSILLAWLAGFVSGQVIEMEGTVRDNKGVPIKNVEISNYGKTDENGHFLLESDTFKYRKALLFIARDYKPKAVPINFSKLKFDVVLEPSLPTDFFQFPPCSAKAPKGVHRIGTWLKLTIPKNSEFKKGFDIDYEWLSIGIGSGSQRRWLRGGRGPNFASVNASADEILNLEEYSYRRTSAGSDWRGTTKDGHYWRYMGSVGPFETYYYETDRKATAEIFDSILDTACFDANAEKI